jgi:hypothetical protein
MVNGANILRTLQIGDVRLTNVKVSRDRLVPYSQTYLGSIATGILGRELFEQYPVTIDYPNRVLTIYRSEAAAASARATGAPVVPMEVVGGAPAVACALDGKSAAPCILDVYLGADIVLSGPGWTFKNQPAMFMRDAEPGREMRGSTLRAHSLAIGALTIAGPLVDVTADEQSYYPEQGRRAMLGSGILSRFAVTIDELGGAFLALGPPSAAASPSPFDGSGLWLIWRGGAVIIRNVVPRSPAAAAGIGNGDVILAIDGKPLQDLDAARGAFMQPAGTKVFVTVERGSRRRDVTITLRSFL